MPSFGTIDEAPFQLFTLQGLNVFGEQQFLLIADKRNNSFV